MSEYSVEVGGLFNPLRRNTVVANVSCGARHRMKTPEALEIRTGTVAEKGVVSHSQFTPPS